MFYSPSSDFTVCSLLYFLFNEKDFMIFHYISMVLSSWVNKEYEYNGELKRFRPNLLGY